MPLHDAFGVNCKKGTITLLLKRRLQVFGMNFLILCLYIVLNIFSKAFDCFAIPA